MAVGELCRTGSVGAGVLLGRKGVVLSRPDRAVDQIDLDARDALVDTDATARASCRFVPSSSTATYIRRAAARQLLLPQ